MNCHIIIRQKYVKFQIGEAGKLKPLEVDLKRLEDISDSIVQDFAAMRKREEEMRSTNGKTKDKIEIELKNNGKCEFNGFYFYSNF